jgi:hypothetical protein
MNKKTGLVLLLIGFLWFSFDLLHAVELLQDGKIIIPDFTDEDIKIDGKLNEKVWSHPPIIKKFKTYHPAYGEVLPQDTEVWTAYDSQNLYFAFKSYDTEPNKIKTSICERDNNLRDDYVGVLLDAMGIKQRSYEFYVNPSGIQADYINSAVSGIDAAPDFVWKSAGKITGNGFNVEICIPLKSIRFKSGQEVKMGIIFVRGISRNGTSGAWPELIAGQTDFNRMSTIIYKDLKSKLKMEILPNFTYSRDIERQTEDSWGEHDSSGNIGVSLKYGITSSITAEATVKPDFSQVESDALQVEFNRRYPIFYSEKRPFFMEGTDVFNLGTFNEGMLISAFHTRRIIDPGWAAKLSGVSGKMAYAVLTANDKAPGQSWAVNANPNEGRDAFWGIARAKYNLGSDNSVGILYSSRYFAESKNNVLGADLQYRPFNHSRLSVTYLYSRTGESVGEQVKHGNAINAVYQRLTKKLDVTAAYERYNDNFIMHSALLNRINISRGFFRIGPNLYSKLKKVRWLHKFHPFFQYSTLHDMGTGMDDTSWILGAVLFFTRQGLFGIRYRNETEFWQGQFYHPICVDFKGQIQINKWLFLAVNGLFGGQIYYGIEEPFLGNGRNLGLSLLIQPDVKINFGLGFIHNELSMKTGNEKFYNVDIINFYSTYQFNKNFFLRGAIRYDSYQKKLLTDFLASFTLIPGTVLHLGYGSIYEKKVWENQEWVPGEGDLLNMKNSFFFKVSYLWRL